MILRALLLAGAVAAAGLAHAADPRIRTVPYDPARVIAVTGHLGYQMMIEFHEDERIEAVSLGDSASWQVTPNRRATHLFLKPVEKASATNMTVVTTARAYVFELRAAEAKGAADPAIVYVLRFAHPAPPAPPPPPPPQPPPRKGPDPERIVRGYVIEGAAPARPSEVFDDGRATWFRFPAGVETPAIFAAGKDAEESLVNWRIEEGFVVVDQLSDRFVLRLGKARALVRREGVR